MEFLIKLNIVRSVNFYDGVIIEKLSSTSWIKILNNNIIFWLMDSKTLLNYENNLEYWKIFSYSGGPT